MDNETPGEAETPMGARPSMPRGAFLPSTQPDELGRVRGEAAAARADLALPPGPDDRAGVFRQLVADDGDIAGLVAYSIYKQNKLDWLNAFTAAKRRTPKDDELAAYIIGEGTPRRLATYRHLAEATLAGDGPDIGAPAVSGPRPAFRRGLLGDRGGLTTSLLAIYALIAVLFIVGFLLAAHYTMSPR